MEINGIKIRKAPTRKRKFYIKKSTDPATAPAPAGTLPQGSDGPDSMQKTEQAIDQFREETRGTGQVVWEFLATQE